MKAPISTTHPRFSIILQSPQYSSSKMKTTLLSALIFLLFAFSTLQHLTLAEPEPVLDTDDNQLVSTGQYHILDAKDKASGVEDAEIRAARCSITVVFGADAKRLNFTPKTEGETAITTEQNLYINFIQPADCATSSNWTVAVDGTKEYPVLIGPPAGVAPMDGSFRIKKSTVTAKAYNLAFHLFDSDDYFLVKSADQNIYHLDLCAETGFDVVFSKFIPDLTSTHVPRIRKSVD